MRRLTAKNVKKGMWISTPDHKLSKIVHVHESVARYISEVPITYKIYRSHYCYTSVSDESSYKMFVLPFYRVWMLKFVQFAKDFFRKW